jgi:hypothetical protein
MENIFSVKVTLPNEAVSRAMRVVSGGWYSPNLQTIKERKTTTSKSRTAAAGGALCLKNSKTSKT